MLSCLEGFLGLGTDINGRDGKDKTRMLHDLIALATGVMIQTSSQSQVL